jgi:predicted NAD/FAD-dependent oxidoreductase
LVLAGEFCANSSIDGAVLSGRRAADVVSAALAPATAGTTA